MRLKDYLNCIVGAIIRGEYFNPHCFFCGKIKTKDNKSILYQIEFHPPVLGDVRWANVCPKCIGGVPLLLFCVRS